jgi:hypothetical protein
MTSAKKTQKLVAELAILVEYDRARTAKRHDYGSGQRSAELMHRRWDLSALGVGASVTHYPAAHVAKEELAAAFERVGRPKLCRAARETYRKNTPATSRTLDTWAMIETWATGTRLALRESPTFVEPPASTQEVIDRAAGVPSSTAEVVGRAAAAPPVPPAEDGAERDGALRVIVSYLSRGGSPSGYPDGVLASARLFTGGASGARNVIDGELARRSTAEGVGRALCGADYSTGPDRDETPHNPYTGRELEL